MKIGHINLAKGFRGGERQTELLVRELGHRQVEQALVCRRHSPLRERLSDVDHLHFYNAANLLSAHWTVPRVDLWHAHEAKGAHWCQLQRRFRGQPYLITRRVPNPIKTNNFTQATYRKASAVVAISSAIEAVLKQYDAALPVARIPSATAQAPANPQAVAEIRRRHAGKFIIGHVGALMDHHKGQSVLIEAARQLNQDYPNLVFMLVGSGADETDLKTRARDLPNVVFTGFQSNVSDYLAAFDLFAFPSLEEGLGSILLDAMDQALPIVATQVDGIPDIIEHDRNGLLVPAGDAEALARSLAFLIDHPQARKRLAATGKQQGQAYSAAAMAERYLKLYQQLLAG